MRRRSLMGGNGLITKGLVIWYDGKNNLQGGGYSQNSTTWYPHYGENSDVLKCFLSKDGNATWNENGGFYKPSTGQTSVYIHDGPRGYGSDYAFTYYADTIQDFTWIAHINIEQYDSSYSETHILGQSDYNGQDTGRYNLKFKPGVVFGIAQNDGRNWREALSDTITEPIKTVAVSRSGSTVNIYVNSTLVKTVSNYSTAPLNGGQYTECTMGSFYHNASYKGDFFGAMCYRRALSDGEVIQMMKYLENRQKNTPVGGI